jgi:hypothetical protein
MHSAKNIFIFGNESNVKFNFGSFNLVIYVQNSEIFDKQNKSYLHPELVA